MARTPSERRRKLEAIRDRRIRRLTGEQECSPSCPSVAGYQYHRKRSEIACKGSRDAWAQYYRDRRKNLKEKE